MSNTTGQDIKQGAQNMYDRAASNAHDAKETAQEKMGMKDSLTGERKRPDESSYTDKAKQMVGMQDSTTGESKNPGESSTLDKAKETLGFQDSTTGESKQPGEDSMLDKAKQTLGFQDSTTGESKNPGENSTLDSAKQMGSDLYTGVRDTIAGAAEATSDTVKNIAGYGKPDPSAGEKLKEDAKDAGRDVRDGAKQMGRDVDARLHDSGASTHAGRDVRV